MGKWDKFCQSCGMPMEKDSQGGGTNADGTRNTKYCSLCYVDGQFKDNFKSSKEMAHFVKDILKKEGISSVKRWFYTMHIPKLERWKTKR